MATKQSKSKTSKSSHKESSKKKEVKKGKSPAKKKDNKTEQETDQESDVHTERQVSPQLQLSQTARQDLKSRFNELPDSDFNGTKDEVISRISLKTKLPVKDLEAYIAGR